MRLLIVQLSDIHIRVAANSVVPRVPQIVNAVRNLDSQIDVAVLLLSGDITNTGQDEEFSVAFDIIRQLQAGLTGEIRNEPPTHIVCIPGNHDCDFSAEQRARDLVVAAVDVAEVPSDSIIGLTTGVQRGFFELRDVLATEGTLAADGRLYYEYVIPLGNEYVRVRCVNSAWLSKLREAPGTLQFPSQLIPSKDSAAAVEIAVIHHPFHWFAPETRRLLQERIEQVSDIIFTGHEHIHTRRVQTIATGEVNSFIEGAALQDNADDSRSTFNTLLVDTASSQQRFERFEWQDDFYRSSAASAWEPFQVNRLRVGKEFQLRPEFEAFLDDPGASFSRAGRNLRLADLFTFPELRKLPFGEKEQPEFVDGAKLIGESDRFANALITGAEQGGKTAFAKAMFREALAQGSVPVFVDGAKFTVPPRGASLHDALLDEFRKQYDEHGIDRYRQLARGQRLLVVDSFDKLRARRGRIEEVLDGFEAFAGRVMLLSNDLAHAVGEIVDAQGVIEGRPQYTQFRIMPFGYAKRTELTTKWFVLDESLSKEDLARKLSDAETAMRIVLGKNYVPAFPVFILAMLQGLEMTGNVDVSASTYGSFYEILIKSQLAGGASQTQYDIRARLLAHIAYHCFVNDRSSLTRAEFSDIHRRYEQQYGLTTLDVRETLDQLRQRHILLLFGDSVEFQYAYIFYYFVAAYLKDHITQEEVRNHIRRMSTMLADERSANVMLFLAHLSREPLIIEQMLEQARKQYSAVEPLRLDEDVKFISDAAAILPEFAYEDGDEVARRHDLAVEQDRAERGGAASGGIVLPSVEVDDAEFYAAVRHELSRLSAALKTIQILGQLLKNFPGSIEAAQKRDIATECYGLAFRVLGALVEWLRKERADLVASLTAMIQEADPHIDQAETTRQANSVIFGLALSATYGIVKRLSFAVGSPELKLTYAAVEEKFPTIGTQLTNLSIELEQFAGFPRTSIIQMAKKLEGAGLPLATLRWMVVSHLNLFPVHFREKQMVCEALDISYPKVVRAPKRNLLAPVHPGSRHRGSD